MTKSGKPYHHGDLRQALLSESERILESEGLPALTLRAAARAAGVSHTAPQNHFGDMTGLLSELAADGHRRLGAAMAEAVAAAGDNAQGKRRAMGRAYLHFARRHPGLFTLMFRSEKLDATRPALAEAIQQSRQSLRDAVIAATPGIAADPLAVAARATAAWAVVHGYVMLMVEGRLKGTLAALPGTDAETLFDAVLDTVSFR